MFGRKKRGVDVVDFTMLQKRTSVLKNRQNSANSNVQPTDGIVDFTSQQNNATTPNTFGFLSDFAQSATPQSNVLSSNSDSGAEINALKIKIDDLEYKLNRLLEKLTEMETKVGRF